MLSSDDDILNDDIFGADFEDSDSGAHPGGKGKKREKYTPDFDLEFDLEDEEPSHAQNASFADSQNPQVGHIPSPKPAETPHKPSEPLSSSSDVIPISTNKGLFGFGSFTRTTPTLVKSTASPSRTTQVSTSIPTSTEPTTPSAKPQTPEAYFDQYKRSLVGESMPNRGATRDFQSWPDDPHAASGSAPSDYIFGGKLS